MEKFMLTIAVNLSFSYNDIPNEMHLTASHFI